MSHSDTSIYYFRTQALTLYSTRTGSKCHTGTQGSNKIELTLRLVHKPCAHWTKMTARFKVVALKPNIIFFTYIYIGCSKKMFLKSALGVKSKF